jgi:acyl dehydratase
MNASERSSQVIDKKWIGHELQASVLPIERSRLQYFSKAIGETDRVYTDSAAARDAGYPDLPAPPTFLFAAELDSGATKTLLADLQIPIAKLLHGEQSFTYMRPACVGDIVTVRSVVSDIYAKKNGALEFVVKTSRATNQRDELVAELRSVLVCRH